jgi:uncharacterized protein with HEPN domain
MTRDPQLYLQDILDSIGKIKRYTADLSFDEFVSNDMVMDAVTRNLEIIGEAAARIPDNIRLYYPNVPWYEMKGMRNIVAHEYFGVDPKIVWKTVQHSLPELSIMIKDIITERK